MMDGYVSEGRQEANDIDRTRVPLVGSASGLVEAPDSNGVLTKLITNTQHGKEQ